MRIFVCRLGLLLGLTIQPSGSVGAFSPQTYWFDAKAAQQAGPPADRPLRCPSLFEPTTDMSHLFAFYGLEHTQSVIDYGKLAALSKRMMAIQRLKLLLIDMEHRGLVKSEGGAASACIVRHLRAWADADAMNHNLEDNDPLGHRVAVMTQAWAGIAFANGYAAAQRFAPVAEEDRRPILTWMDRLSSSIAAEFGPHGPRPKQWQWLDLTSNQSYWAAAAVGSFSALSGDRRGTDFAMAELRRGLSYADKDGGLADELARGHRALHYQCFAVYALSILVAEADAAGIALSPDDEQRLQRIAYFTLHALQDPQSIEKRVGYTQDIKPEAAIWLEVLYPHMARTAPQLAVEMEAAAAKRRPLSDLFTGLPATALFRR